MEEKILPWLITVPASDINFKSNLNNADLETCECALLYSGLSKKARKMIESRIKKLR